MTITAPDGRHVHIWHDNNIDELTAAIASTIEVYNHNGVLATLNGTGQLIPISMTDFKRLIDESVCGIRVVANGSGGYKKEYFTYRFPHIPHPGPPTAAQGKHSIWTTQRG